MDPLETKFIVQELKQLEGGIIRKIFHTGRKEFYIEVEDRGKQRKAFIIGGERIFLTEKKQKSPGEPSTFCMYLRKHLIDKSVGRVVQAGFEPVIALDTGQEKLVVEMCDGGNVVLCDEKKIIIAPLEIRVEKLREIRAGKLYQTPQRGWDPFTMEFDQYRQLLLRDSGTVKRFVEGQLGFGKYADAVLQKAAVAGGKKANQLPLEEMVQLQKAVKVLAPAPSVAGGEMFVLGGKGTVFPSVSAALEATYIPEPVPADQQRHRETVADGRTAEEPGGTTTQTASEADEHKEKMAPDETNEQKNILARSPEPAEQRDGGALSTIHQEEVERALAGILRAREAGMTLEEIRIKAVEEGSPIKRIREDGIVEMEVGGKQVMVPLPAGSLTQTVVEKTEEKQEEKAEEKTEEPEELKERKRWYESYRWFYSSENVLVIAGLGPEQNERVWKRAKPGDVVVWADGQEAILTVIKQAREQIVGEVTRKEAAEFAGALAQAWTAATDDADVFMVRPEHIVKQGKVLMINGEKNWYRSVGVRMAVGMKVDPELGKARLVAGPLMAVRRHADYLVTLRPGLETSYDLAVRVKNKLLGKCRPYDSGLIEKVGVEEIQRLLPAGGGQVVEGVL